MKCPHCGNENNNHYLGGEKHQRRAKCGACKLSFVGSFFTDDWTAEQWQAYNEEREARDKAREILSAQTGNSPDSFEVYVSAYLMSNTKLFDFVKNKGAK